MDPAEFVMEVWRKQQQKGYGFLSAKSELLGWQDFPFKVPGPVILPEDFELPGDFYFTPNLFYNPRRRLEYMLPSRWLYADLDKVDPGTIKKKHGIPKPTVAWESSPGRYQCMWLLNEAVHREEHGWINQRLTYAIGADKGGWDATQVLRIPGTRNYKYPSQPEVTILWMKTSTTSRSKNS